MKVIRAASADCADLSTAPIGLRAALSHDFLSLLSSIGKERIVLHGDEIEYTLDCADNIICIDSGSVKIVSILLDGRQQIVDFLTAGDLIFKASSDDCSQRTAVAVSGVRIFEFELQDMLQALAGKEGLRREFFSHMLAAVDSKSRHISALGRMRSEERVAYFLLDLSKRTGHLDSKDGALRLPLYRSEIADYLGLTTETVSRVFSALRDLGLIRLAAPDQVVIEDAARLALIASGRAREAAK